MSIQFQDQRKNNSKVRKNRFESAARVIKSCFSNKIMKAWVIPIFNSGIAPSFLRDMFRIYFSYSPSLNTNLTNNT